MLLEFFGRLFHVVSKMEKHETSVKSINFQRSSRECLKEGEEADIAERPTDSVADSGSIFFIQHQDQLDPDLRQWVDLKGLPKSNLQLSSEPDDVLSEDLYRSRRNRRRAKARRHPHPAVGIKRNRCPNIRVPKPELAAAMPC
jgi:hypothetical protein